MRKTKRPEVLGNILNKVISKIEKSGPGKREKILSAWKEVAGEKASTHSRPVSIRKKVLTIEVDSSTWLYEINLKKRDFLKEIKKRLKQYRVEDIRFRMGSIS